MTRPRLYYDVLVITLMTAMAAAPVPRSQAQTRQRPSRAPITVEIHAQGARPLAKALDILEQRHDIVICYEDPPLEHDEELQDISNKTIRPAGSRQEGRLVLPRFGSLVFEYRIDEEGRPVDEPLDLLRRLIAAYHAQVGIGRFEIESRGGVHIIQPTHYRAADGRFVPYTSILDLRIEFEAAHTGIHDAVEALIAQIEGVLDRRLWMGSVPTNLFMNKSLPRAVSGRSGKEGLLDVFASIGHRLSWRLFHDPQNEVHVLNIHGIRKAPPVTPLSGSASSISRILELLIAGERPEAAALGIVQERCGWRIGYEDPRLSGYRSGLIRFRFAVDADLQPIDQPQLIESLLASFKAGAIAGKWRVDLENDRYHVVPVAGHSARLAQEGNGFIEQEAVLDTQVTLARGEESAEQLLSALCARLTETSGHHVVLARLPASVGSRELLQTRQSRRQTASAYLDDVLSDIGGEHSYYLFHDPIKNQYRLNLRPRSSKAAPLPALP